RSDDSADLFPVEESKLNRLVQLTALRTTRAVHVRIVRVNVSATLAAKNPVLAVRGMETAPAHFRMNAHAAEHHEQSNHISENERGRAHIREHQPADWMQATERCAT